ncbi:MAG: hypothetical protein KDC57_21215 [Saprospiraceae bacterium]|nr:hypothetical protein [Saprospiraceae bacterium]
MTRMLHNIRILLPITFLFFLPSFASGQSLGFLDTTAQLFIGGASTYILPKDQVEVQFTNGLTSYWLAYYEFTSDNYSRIANRHRITFFQQKLRAMYGFSASQRWDLGIEANYNHYRDDDNARSSPLRVFSDAHPETGYSYRGLATLGFRFRTTPLASLPEWTVQAGYSFPVGSLSATEKRLLNSDVSTVDVLSTFFRKIGEGSYYFVQAQGLYQYSDIRLNYQASGSFFLVQRLGGGTWYLYPGVNYVWNAQSQKNGNFNNVTQIIFGGLGLQWQPRFRYSLSLVYLYPFRYDIGSPFLEVVPNSYASVSLGLRVLFN